jgi:hypothetical protein
MSTTTLVQKDVAEETFDHKDISDKEKQELIHADAISIASGTTLGPTEADFKAVKTLNISAKGIPVLRIPAPSSELQINIYNEDGSVAYQSTRGRRSSGNSVLTDAEGRQLIATEYFFGPGRDPTLHLLGGEETASVRTVSKWTSRSQTFLLSDGREFTWEYKKERGFGKDDKKGTALVMMLQGKRVAALIRNEETRTPGSKGCSAGNGGALLLGEQVGTKEGVSEELVVASCLLMLKKEVDRRRAVQMFTLVAIVS